MTFKQRLGLFSAGILSMVLGQQAHAQEINYGGLEEMFGQPVTTSATGSPQTASQVPANMQIISSDQIRQSGATDIPDILRYVAGVDVRSYGAMDKEVSIGGYSQAFNPRLLVLINGRQVYLDDYGYTSWQSLPVQLADIRQIEIVRGPASALFGFNAVSGVINIITYDPIFDKTNTLTVGIGTDGTYQGSLVSTLNEPGKGGVTVQLGGLKTNEYANVETAKDYDLGDSDPFNANYAIDGRYKPTSNTELTAEITQSDARSDDMSPQYDYFTTQYRTQSFKTSFAADTKYGVITLLGYINQAKIGYAQGNLNAFDDNQIDVVQLSDLFKIANVHSIRVEFEYRDNRDGGSLLGGTVHYQNFAASAMWNWQITPELSLTTAGRVDHLELNRTDPLPSVDPFTLSEYQHSHFTEPTYNVGLVWQPTDNDTFRLLTGRSIQSPSLIDYGFVLKESVGPLTLVDAGNPNLKPAITTNYEVDYDRQLPVISSTLRTSVFYNMTRDFITSAGDTPTALSYPLLLSYAQNVGQGAAMGGEVGIQGSNAAGLRWNLAYTLTGERDKVIGGSPSGTSGWDNATPTSAIVFGLGYSWQKWEADVAGRWQSNYQNYWVAGSGGAKQLITTQDYLTMSGRIGYQVTPHITLAVAGQQLTGTQIVESAGLEPERRVLFSAAVQF